MAYVPWEAISGPLCVPTLFVMMLFVWFRRLWPKDLKLRVVFQPVDEIGGGGSAWPREEASRLLFDDDNAFAFARRRVHFLAGFL